MTHTIFTAGACPRCKITKRFMDEQGISFEEVDIKVGGMDTFREFYRANRGSVFRGREGIEFPVFTDGKAVRQGVGVVIAYLTAGSKLDGFIGRAELFKGWIDGLHISGGDPSLVEEFVGVLSFLKKSSLQLQLDTAGKNAPVLERLIEGGLGDRVFMDVKGPLALYGRLLGEKIDRADIEKTISLLPKFPKYEFRTTVVPVIRKGGKKPEITYLSPEEIGETAKLIREASGSHQHPYLLRIFDPVAGADEKSKDIEKLSLNAMLKYRSAAREYLPRAEIEKS